MKPTFSLPPKRHAPAPSLTLARNRTGPPSVTGSVGSDGGGGGRGPPKSPRSPRSPYDPSGAGADLDAVPLLPLSPVDAGAWAAENAHPPRRPSAQAAAAVPPYVEEADEDAEEVDEGARDEGDEDATPRPTDVAAADDRRRVQFAPAATVALFDAEDPDTECEATEFEVPRGRELLYVVISVAGLGVFGLAAVLTTIYDWVL